MTFASRGNGHHKDREIFGRFIYSSDISGGVWTANLLLYKRNHGLHNSNLLSNLKRDMIKRLNIYLKHALPITPPPPDVLLCDRAMRSNAYNGGYIACFAGSMLILSVVSRRSTRRDSRSKPCRQEWLLVCSLQA